MDYSKSMVYLILALIVSIISPLMTVLITKYFDYLSKRLDAYETRRLDKIEQYINSVAAYIRARSFKSDFTDVSDSILLYIPPEFSSYVSDIQFAIQTSNFDLASSVLHELCISLNKSHYLSTIYPVKKKRRNSNDHDKY